MRKLVYIETTLPSLYFSTATDAETITFRHWTRTWWDTQSRHYDLVTSAAVIEELKNGKYPHQRDAVALARSLPVLDITPEIMDIVDVYVARHVMPADPSGDALHLAVASFHKADFLLTWNCNHLANANKFGHIRLVNSLLSLFTPDLVTPLELMRREKHDEGKSNN